MEVSRVTPATRMFLPSRMPTGLRSALENVVRFCSGNVVRSMRPSTGSGHIVDGSVAHAKAAVDGYHRASDVAGRVAGEELHRARDVVHGSESAKGDLVGILLDQVFAERGGHVCLDESRRHHIRRYAARAQFTGEGTRHADQTRLGRGV